jgi:hypothetical protein
MLVLYKCIKYAAKAMLLLQINKEERPNR